jgi:hypothetical protein
LRCEKFLDGGPDAKIERLSRSCHDVLEPASREGTADCSADEAAVAGNEYRRGFVDAFRHSCWRSTA